jgi:muramoyltetrapeptide carboxypeptidase
MKKPTTICKPCRLSPGDTVGVISPSSRPIKESLQNGTSWLIAHGFQVEMGKSVLDEYGYLAGSDEDRANDIMNMFTNPRIDAIWCAQGGYGAMRTLSHLNFEKIKDNPKIFIGYSDITAFHAAFYKLANFVTFHGPLLAHEIGGSLTAFTENSVWHALTSIEPIGLIRNPVGAITCHTIQDGIATGKIVGGNLSLIANLMGTPYEMDFDDKIVFIEDVGEAPYRIDRMLTQLVIANKFKHAKGIIIGETVDCKPSNENQKSLTLDEVLSDVIKPLNIPSFYGLVVGHGQDKATIPLGVDAVMDASNCTVEILESGVK